MDEISTRTYSPEEIRKFILNVPDIWIELEPIVSKAIKEKIQDRNFSLSSESKFLIYRYVFMPDILKVHKDGILLTEIWKVTGIRRDAYYKMMDKESMRLAFDIDYVISNDLESVRIGKNQFKMVEKKDAMRYDKRRGPNPSYLKFPHTDNAMKNNIQSSIGNIEELKKYFENDVEIRNKIILMKPYLHYLDVAYTNDGNLNKIFRMLEIIKQYCNGVSSHYGEKIDFSSHRAFIQYIDSVKGYIQNEGYQNYIESKDSDDRTVDFSYMTNGLKLFSLIVLSTSSIADKFLKWVDPDSVLKLN